MCGLCMGLSWSCVLPLTSSNIQMKSYELWSCLDLWTLMKLINDWAFSESVFRDDQKEERKRRRSRSSEMTRKRRGPRTPPESPPGSPSDGDIDTVDELERRIAPTWQGFVILKKTEYAIRLHRISGTEHLLQKLLRDPADGSALKLHITQRLPLASQEALEDRLINSSKKQLSLMIAIACDKSIRPLVNYLCEKEAAGVVSVPGGVLYVFAPSNMADRLVHACAPRVNLLTPECSHLLFALALKASSNTPSNGS